MLIVHVCAEISPFHRSFLWLFTMCNTFVIACNRNVILCNKSVIFHTRLLTINAYNFARVNTSLKGKTMQERHTDYARYFRESEESCEKYYLPYLKEYTSLILKYDTRVLEVGCGLGGNLAPFARKGCDVSGVDIDPQSIDKAKDLFDKCGLNGTFTCCDIHDYKADCAFQLIMLHDAIEHIKEKKCLMARLRELLTEDGVLYIAFPAWCMPFGGHQQVARTKFVSRCPFIHLLPKGLFVWLLRRFGEPKVVVQDFLNIRQTRMSVQTFEELCNDMGLEIIHRRLYLINPHYEIKFGMKPRTLWRAISAIPYFRDFFSTSCHYLVRERKKNDS